MNWRDYIKNMKQAHVGKEVSYQGNKYTVVDVDYNGALLINKPSEFNETTAVDISQLD